MGRDMTCVICDEPMTYSDDHDQGEAQIKCLDLAHDKALERIKELESELEDSNRTADGYIAIDGLHVFEIVKPDGGQKPFVRKAGVLEWNLYQDDPFIEYPEFNKLYSTRQFAEDALKEESNETLS